MKFAWLIVLAATAVFGGEVSIDFSVARGAMKPLHGVNNAPVRLNGKLDEFRRAGIPFVRTHDTCGAWGGAICGCCVDGV